MNTILTFGVFDMLHLGHIALFKKLADYVTVAGGASSCRSARYRLCAKI